MCDCRKCENVGEGAGSLAARAYDVSRVLILLRHICFFLRGRFFYFGSKQQSHISLCDIMSFSDSDDDSSGFGVSGQTKLDSFLFSKTHQTLLELFVSRRRTRGVPSATCRNGLWCLSVIIV